VDGFDPKILQYSLMAATLVKVVVDVANIATPAETPPWMSPLLALLLGPLMVAALMLAAGVQISAQTAAQAVIAGVLAAGTAGVASSLQARTKPSSHATDGVANPPPVDGHSATAEEIADALERAREKRISARLHERADDNAAAPDDALISRPPTWLPQSRDHV